MAQSAPPSPQPQPPPLALPPSPSLTPSPQPPPAKTRARTLRDMTVHDLLYRLHFTTRDPALRDRIAALVAALPAETLDEPTPQDRESLLLACLVPLLQSDEFQSGRCRAAVEAFAAPLVVPLREESLAAVTRPLVADPPISLLPSLPSCWEPDRFVLFPCHPQNVAPPRHRHSPPTADSSTAGTNSPRGAEWENVQTRLRAPVRSPEALVSCIAQNAGHRIVGKALTHVLDSAYSPAERSAFFDVVLPRMCRLALALPDICPNAIPLLKRQQAAQLVLTQQQVACLLANMFFCTFPRTRRSDGDELPSVSFAGVFESPTNWPSQIAKLKCFLNYFRRVVTHMPEGIITIRRLVLAHSSVSSFDGIITASSQPLSRFESRSSGGIDDAPLGALQVDFGHKAFGGHVLELGNVQEEIRCTVNPELLVARLVCELIESNESIVVSGSEQFCAYEGYGSDFKFVGDYIDPRPRDALGHRLSHLTSIDAHPYRSQRSSEEFSHRFMLRETIKAYVGFNVPECSTVATGNWGCGMLNGDPDLKTLLQWIAASQLDKSLIYYTFGNADLTRRQQDLAATLPRLGVTVGELWSIIQSFLIEQPSKTGLIDFAIARARQIHLQCHL
eukprot:gnl/Spiro4/6793_TR3511_c0_g1_i1.p1 gnl/Spiro4/6793_TR3511_c0_g1~~gnl/Spiro4/6793_TR3511_c0_g1_i1.p1  ORF type:complete len:618 (-),score=189.44 gnl/Spiro4/6793_TR3511_c0_g1_i1:194-2047(-)